MTLGTLPMPSLLAFYFVLQGIAIVAWWLVLLVVPASREFFLPRHLDELALLGFWLSDALAAAGSLYAGWCMFRASRNRVASVWFVAGCMTYAALYCVGISILAGSGWLAAAFMAPAAILSVGGAWLATRD